MKKWLLAVSILSLVFSLTACAHREAAYGYGGAFVEGCEFDQECYAGPQYTCVFFQPPTAQTRMQNAVAKRHGSPRVVNPHEGLAGGSPGPTAPSSTSYTAPAPAPVARAPVVMASPSSGGRTPQSRN
jgi:hypothetical protein